VDIISIIGSECSLDTLSIVSEATGGSIERVDPGDLIKEGKESALGALVGRKVLATGCIAMAVLHRGLHFKGENQDDDHDRNWVIRDLGNINENTSVSFSFAFRPKNECDLSGLGRLPIQMQFLYTGEDGSQLLRVTTSYVSLTEDEAEAEAGADLSLISAHAQQRAAQLAKDGQYKEAKEENEAVLNFLKKRDEAAAKAYQLQVGDLEDALEEEIERGEKGGQRSDKAAHAISKLRRK